MRVNDYVIINGRAYDTITGLPVDNISIENQPTQQQIVAEEPTLASIVRGVTTPSVHQTPQHSSTLSRRYVKKPNQIATEKTQLAKAPIVANYSPVHVENLSAEKSPEVEKFVPIQVKTPQMTSQDRPATAHPMTQRAAGRALDINSPQKQRNLARQKFDLQAHQQMQRSSAATPKPAITLKNEAIHEAMNREVSSSKRQRAKKQSSRKFSKFLAFASSGLAILVLAGYMTYLNMPNLSIKMAAVQSGVNAKYPGYQPDGYALNGPITFKNGEVSMRFAYADGNRYFKITQKASNWDSSAVRQFVDDKADDSVATTIDGLTIFTYGSNATWVNSGVLYTVEGDAPLSSSQIHKIATSM